MSVKGFFLFVGFDVKLCQLVQIRTSVVEILMKIQENLRFRLVQICTSVVEPSMGIGNFFGFRLVQIRTSVVAKANAKILIVEF